MNVTDAYDYVTKLKEILMSQSKIEEVSIKFNSMNCMAEKIIYLEKLLIDYELMPGNVLKKEKNEEKAKTYRNQGNVKYQRKNFLGALELYNKSLCFSPDDCENIGTVYANRSAVFFELKLYDKSLENVQLAILNGYKNAEKLEERGKKCVEKINNNHDLQLLYEPIGHEYFKLSHPPNPKVPFIANCLELKSSNMFGRYVVTNKKLKPGEIIAIEEPFSKCLLKDENYKYCCNCLGDNCLNLFPCPDCTQAMFCSEQCFREGCAKFHRYECTIMDALRKICTKIMRISVQTFFESLSIFNHDVLSLMNALIETFDTPTTVFDHDLSVEDMKKSRLLSTIDALENNQINRSPSDIFQRAGIVAIVTHLFLNHTILKDVLAKKRFRDFFRKFICKQTQIAAINYHGIFDGVMTKTQSSLSPQFASGSFPFCSLINHSCAPNIVRVSINCKNHIMVNRPIDVGEQLFDNYGYHHCLEDFPSRQDSLQNQYMFKCSCYACINDYPLFQKLPRLDVNFDRFLGNDVAALAEMNTETAKNRFKEYCEYLDKMDSNYPCYEISCLQECILRCSFIFKSTPFKLKLLQRD